MAKDTLTELANVNSLLYRSSKPMRWPKINVLSDRLNSWMLSIFDKICQTSSGREALQFSTLTSPMRLREPARKLAELRIFTA
mmetsp:Transcript_62314/g.202069  ORF Transcript_62314/g.202069 Transcript_62314/m.202069 type:complete len:83 (-) Transcript_62314:1819-2067(-)